MAKKIKIVRPKPRLPKGMRDIAPAELRATRDMLARIEEMYELYGFEPLDTPAFEYSDALGKFLPDQDRPNAGVFSFEDEDGDWLSLRYDLTAPLARHVAANYDALAKPFRRYQTGPVWRNEKPGPGRFRQFTQFDADTVGTSNIAADAELCMLAADTIEHLGLARGEYRINVNNRKLLDGVLTDVGIDPAADETATLRMSVLRAIDKRDRLGKDGVALLLGEGRKDESGAFTPGAQLTPDQIEPILAFVEAGFEGGNRSEILARLEDIAGGTDIGREGLDELRQMHDLLSHASYGDDRVVIEPSIVRGLDYYTGPVFEAELTFEVKDEKGQVRRFGSVGGGGRYDGLIARFKGVEIPATGFSIGVSRLQAAIAARSGHTDQVTSPLTIVTVMEAEQQPRYQVLTKRLRDAGLRAEMYVGTSGMRAQLKYADKRGATCVIIEGEDERAAGEIMIKDLIKGAELSEQIDDNKAWREGRPAQFAVAEDELVEAVRSVIQRHEKGGDT